MNKTKIIATIGPMSKDKNTLKKMITLGADVLRLNLNYASHEFCKKIVDNVNELNDELNTNVAVMFDIQGHGIRVGKFKDGQANLEENTKVNIYINEIEGTNEKFSVNFDKLVETVKYHTEIKLADGDIVLRVVDKELEYITCEVLKGGIIKDNQGFNIIGFKHNCKYLSEKDKNDIKYASKIGVDFLALPHVRTPEDVLEVTDLLIDIKDDHLDLIAKIENESAINELDAIIKVSDGIMVSRGDLGIEFPIERVPSLTKMIINKCHIAGCVSIVSTQMLSSMETDLNPTRAEVSDVANAVIDGVDAVMLSGETTIGMYPSQTVEMMEKIIGAAECDIDYFSLLNKAMRTQTQDVTASIAYSVTECANRLKCKVIVAPTFSGYTAKKISRFRPNCPIIALCPDKKIVKSLSLYYGVAAYYVSNLESFDKIMSRAKKIVMEKVSMNAFDKYIITGGYPFKGVKHTNFMKIEEI
jgi:pyruvate kinase